MNFRFYIFQIIKSQIVDGGLLQRFKRSEKGLIEVNTKMKRSDRIVSVFKDKKENFKLFVSFFYKTVYVYFIVFKIVCRL